MTDGYSEISRMARFVWIQITGKIIRKRWLIPVLIALLIGSNETNRFVLQRTGYGNSYNGWDILFSVFSNGNYLLFVLNNIFLFLIFDITTESEFGQTLILKLGSREKWWVSKVVLLGISVICFATINITIVFGITSFSFSIQEKWSLGAQLVPENSYLSAGMLATLPFPLFIRVLSLLNLGWFGLGLFTLVISTFSRRSIVGFLAGVALNFVGLIIYKGSFSPAITSLSFPQHMILNLQYAKMQELLPVSSFHFSLLYWSFWILLLLFSGMQLGKRKDFFGGAHLR